MNKRAPSSIGKLLLGLLLCLAPWNASARLLQIIHTNDLHSHLEHAEDRQFGGYAAVKATIDALKSEATAQGIESLILDSGDFSEGSQFFLADRGEATWRILDAMGYDAVTIGNHDWLMGHADLDRIVGNVKPSFKLLGANFIFHRKHKNLVKHMRPHASFERAGVRIAILGLTTDHFVYNWRADDGYIWDPVEEADARLPSLRKRHDFVIALTHLGVMPDINLVRNTAGIDLVVGGHSHSRLGKPVEVIDERGRKVPIVQAGKHGELVGELIVDLEPGKPLQIISYRLVPVNNEGPHDSHVAEMVTGARENLEDQYGRDWLYETIGFSEVPIISPENAPTAWSQFTIDAMRESGNADVALDVAEFYGMSMPPGPVTREQLFVFYPRIFAFNKYGWTVWTCKVRGWVLRRAMAESVLRGYWLNTSGLTYDVYVKNGERKVKNLRVNGTPLDDNRSYNVALPEGIGRGIVDIVPVLTTVFRNAQDTHIPIWFALEEKLRRVGTVKPTLTRRR